MLDIMIILSLVNVFIMLASLPLIFKKVRRNIFYGFRTGITLENEKVWYEVNARTGKYLFYYALAGLILCIILFFIPGISKGFYTILLSIYMIGGVISVLIYGLILSIKIERKVMEAELK